MRITVVFIAALLMGIFCISCNESNSGHGDPIHLKFNFATGDTYEYTTETKQNISSEVLGTRINIDQNMVLESQYAATDNTAGQHEITVTNKRINIKSSNNAVMLEYDSADSTKQNEMFKGIGTMLNRPFKFSISDQGEITDLNTYNNSTGPDDAFSQLSEPINDSSIRLMMQLMLDIYPDKPVKTGATWTKNNTMSIGFMTISCDNNYKLTSVSHGIAHIDVNSKLKSQTTGDAKGQSMTVDMKGVQTGTLQIEVATGAIKEGVLTQQMAGRIGMMGMDAETTINSDMKISGRKL